MNFAESCHKVCRNRKKRSVSSTSQFTRYSRSEIELVSFVWKRLLIWLYKSFYGPFLLCGKPYGTIRQSSLTIRTHAEDCAWVRLFRHFGAGHSLDTFL